MAELVITDSAIHWLEGALKSPTQEALPPVSVTSGTLAAAGGVLEALVKLGLVTNDI